MLLDSEEETDRERREERVGDTFSVNQIDKERKKTEGERSVLDAEGS